MGCGDSKEKKDPQAAEAAKLGPTSYDWSSNCFEVNTQDIQNQFPKITDQFSALKYFQHFVNQTVARDLYPGSWCSVVWQAPPASEEEAAKRNAEGGARRSRPPASAEEQQSIDDPGAENFDIPAQVWVKICGPTPDMAVQEAQQQAWFNVALKAYGDYTAWIAGGGKPEADWYFSVDWGCPLQNYEVVQLLHFPPTDSGVYADFLYAETLTRWDLLLTQNGMSADQVSRQQRILDLVPIVAPAGDGSKLPNTAFNDYPKAGLDVLLSYNLGSSAYTKPIVAFGTPVRDWLWNTYQDQIKPQYPNGLSTNDVFTLTGLSSKSPSAITPVLVTNHPSAWTYDSNIDPSKWPDPTPGGYPSPDSVMTQDLIGAAWHTLMVSGQYNKEGGPQAAMKTATEFWSNIQDIHNAEYNHQGAFSYWWLWKYYGPSPSWPNPILLAGPNPPTIDTPPDDLRRLLQEHVDAEKPKKAAEAGGMSNGLTKVLEWSVFSCNTTKQWILNQFPTIAPQGDFATMKYFAHFVNQSLVRDGYRGTWAQVVWEAQPANAAAEGSEEQPAANDDDNNNQSRQTRPPRDPETGLELASDKGAPVVPNSVALRICGPADVANEVIQFLNFWLISATAQKEYTAWIAGGGKPAADWYFSTDHGCPVTNYEVVQLLHFPPTDSGVYADFLYAETLTRWDSLCKQNGMADVTIPKQQRILDLVPIVAPASDGSKLPNTAFNDYPKEGLNWFLGYGMGKDDFWTRPIIAFGSPVKDWLWNTYQDQIKQQYPDGLKVNDVFTLKGLVALRPNALTPVIIANHPSAWTYDSGIVPEKWNDPTSGGYPAPTVVMTQDLEEAGWHTLMITGQYNKDGGPQAAIKETEAFWGGSDNITKVENVEYQHQGAYSYWIVQHPYGPSPKWPAHLTA